MYVNVKNRIFGLDLLRAIAILLVLISHSSILLFHEKESFLLNLIRFFGTIGVDLFFVLSGYLIGTMLLKQLLNEQVKFKDFLYFWVRRWFRTLPNYFLILSLNILIFYGLHHFIINRIGDFFLFIQNFKKPHPEFFTEAWSLSIEEYAYIIGPVLLMLLLALFKKTSKKMLFLIMVLSVIFLITLLRLNFHFHHDELSNHDWSQQLRKVVIYRIDSIYYGFLAAFGIHYYYNFIKKIKNQLLVLGIIIFFGLHTLVFIFEIEPDNATLFYNLFYLPFVSVSLLLFFPSCIHWKNGKLFKNEIITISVLSYGLYLINYSLVLLTLQYFINIEELPILIKALILIGYWGLSFGFAYLLYIYFEKPIMDLRDSKFIKSLFIK